MTVKRKLEKDIGEKKLFYNPLILKYYLRDFHLFWDRTDVGTPWL